MRVFKPAVVAALIPLQAVAATPAEKVTAAAKQVWEAAGAGDACGVSSQPLVEMYFDSLRAVGVIGSELRLLAGQVERGRKEAADKLRSIMAGKGIRECPPQLLANIQARLGTIKGTLAEAIKEHAEDATPSGVVPRPAPGGAPDTVPMGTYNCYSYINGMATYTNTDLEIQAGNRWAIGDDTGSYSYSNGRLSFSGKLSNAIGDLKIKSRNIPQINLVYDGDAWKSLECSMSR